MPTVIDSFIVTLGLDSSGFKKGKAEASDAMKGVRDDANTTAKELESKGSVAAEFFGIIERKVAGVTAALVGFASVKATIQDTVDTVAALGRAAQVTGMKVDDLAAFGKAIARNGGDAAAATQEINNLVQAREQWLTTGTGSQEFMKFLSFIGGNLNDSPLEDIEKFADYAKKNKTDPALIAQVGGWGGLGQNTITEAMKGRAGVDADLAESRRLGVPGPADVSAARNLQGSFIALGQAIDGVTMRLTTKNASAVLDFFDFLKDYIINGPSLWTGLVPDGTAPFLTGIEPGGFAADFLARYGAHLYGNERQSHSQTIPNGGTAQTADDRVLEMFRRLEGTPDGRTSSAGAVGIYQIEPGTSAQHGGSSDPELLRDPTYNKIMARKIISDLIKKYQGDMEAVAIAYHSGEGSADKWLAANRNDAVLGPAGRAYVAHERALSYMLQLPKPLTLPNASQMPHIPSAADSINATPGPQSNSTSTSTVHIQTLAVYTQATDATGIVADLQKSLQENGLFAAQANTGLS